MAIGSTTDDTVRAVPVALAAWVSADVILTGVGKEAGVVALGIRAMYIS
jgi:hypothetical protein